MCSVFKQEEKNPKSLNCSHLPYYIDLCNPPSRHLDVPHISQTNSRNTEFSPKASSRKPFFSELYSSLAEHEIGYLLFQ